MIPYSDAERLARLWVDVISRGTSALHEGAALAKPYGWVFFWDGREFIETKNPRKRFAGNAPVLVDNVNAEVRVTGTAAPLDHYLAEYEATLPPSRLTLTPERPGGVNNQTLLWNGPRRVQLCYTPTPSRVSRCRPHL